MSSPLHVVRSGRGPIALLIHGSATDRTTWSIQLASNLKLQLTLVAYDRRPEGSVEQHAADAAGLLAGVPPALVIGSSFGGVIALELIRSRPELARGAILIEPPMAPADDIPPAPGSFLADFDRTVAEEGGPAAGEMFLRMVLGDAAFDRMPRAFRERAMARWAEIRADSVALIAYRPRYAELAHVATPVLLLGGERSAPYYRPTLEALARSLPATRLATVPGAGHMLHAEAHRRFHEHVLEFAASLAPA